ncbi:hypothetical protein PPGU19_092920 (plasmid) [Paraburkholderia sp. PGU19]|nr:hypothetical protein PPGU19_092920 [Paraburkholderia sp. PGU19]
MLDVQAAMAAGFPAAHVYPASAGLNLRNDAELRVAFDGDSVLFSYEAERIFRLMQLEQFIDHEVRNARDPLPPGPMKPFLDALCLLQNGRKSGVAVRTALVTARSAPAHERAIRTLMAWGVTVDEAMPRNELNFEDDEGGEMGELALCSGGKIEYGYWADDDVTGEKNYVWSDVTDSTVAYLMEPVQFRGAIYVRDIFSLLDRNRGVVDVFRRLYAADYLAESKKGDAVPYTGEYDPQGVEYLELFYDWEKDNQTGELRGVHRLWVGGVGFELRDDVVEDGQIRYQQGTRIRWAIKFSPIGDILNLPLRINSEVDVTDSENITRTVHTFQILNPTLAQVIQALLWELSWAGSPSDTEDLAATIRDAADEAEMSEPMSAEDFIESLKKLG